MSQKQARRARQISRPSAYQKNLVLDKRYEETSERRAALALEKADIKAEKIANRSNRGLASVAN